MSTIVRNRSAGFYTGFYWVGVTMTIVCFAVLLASNTDLFYRIEHSRFPLSWMAGCLSILSFLAAEFCHAQDSLKNDAQESAELAPEWDAIEA